MVERLKPKSLCIHCLVLLVVILPQLGCSSLGLSLWPAHFPLLPKAKEFSVASPVPSGLEHELQRSALPNYFVEPGDRLLIEPTDLDSDFQSFGDQEVRIDGSIDLGKFGRLRVSGMTVEEIENAIADQVAQFQDDLQNVNVQLVETNGAKVYVLGAVGSPGVYPIHGSETVLDAILLAGGLTSTASPCDILMVRPTDGCSCRVVQRVCYRQITQLGDVTTNYQLRPGDRVFVGERTLCEELSIWKQYSSCSCCDRSHCVEKNPAVQQYSNRFTRLFAPFPLPPSSRQTQEAEQASAQPSAGIIQRADDIQTGDPAGTVDGVPSYESKSSDQNGFLMEPLDIEAELKKAESSKRAK